MSDRIHGLRQSTPVLSVAGRMCFMTVPRSSCFALWTEFQERIEPVRKDLPDGLAAALALDAITDPIRLTRNEAAHPTGRQIDEDTARVHQTIAPERLRKVHLLAAHFAGMPAGAEA